MVCDLVDIRAGCDDKASEAARAALPLPRSGGREGGGGGDGAPSCGWCADATAAECNERFFVDPWMLQGNGMLGVRRCEEQRDGSCRAAAESIRCGKIQPPPTPPAPLLPLLPMRPPSPTQPTVSSADLDALFGANHVVGADSAVSAVSADSEDRAEEVQVVTRISVASPSRPVFSSRDTTTTGVTDVFAAAGAVWRHDDEVEAAARVAGAQAGRLDAIESTPSPYASTASMVAAGFGAAIAAMLLMAIYRCCVSLLNRLWRCVRCVCWCCFRAPGGRRQRFEGVPSKEVLPEGVQ